MGALEGCAPRKTSVLGAKYDTRERGIHETFGKKNPCLPEPSIQIREAPVLGYRSCTGGIIFSWLLRVAGSACITVCKEIFTKPVCPGFSQNFHYLQIPEAVQSAGTVRDHTGTWGLVGRSLVPFPANQG